jgi:hypothetical protein
MKEKRTDSILLKLKPTEKKILEELAKDNGIDMADVLRSPIIDELKRRRQMECVA